MATMARLPAKGGVGTAEDAVWGELREVCQETLRRNHPGDREGKGGEAVEALLAKMAYG